MISGCSKHMTGNRALLMNFVEKFLETVCFGNNDFAVIAGYGDVVIGSMTIKKVYYVEGLGHNFFSVGQFCNKGLEVAFRKSTCFVRNEDGVDLLTCDRSSNLYTIALNEVASNFDLSSSKGFFIAILVVASTHCQEDRTAINVKKKLPVKSGSYAKRISFNTHLTFTFYSKQDMDQQYPTVVKIPMLDTGKFKQWQFRMQQYLQHEHYALWEVIKFEDSYTAPEDIPSTTTTSTTSGEKSGRTVTLTTKDMQKKKNDVKARTTLLLSLPDEHQLRFSNTKLPKNFGL
nr:integrase, catalytic region, zinc finger, CCHC-type, peptidase aspartic, catalytic [Tanacetum cinerariifolium]